ncbi:PREDICTED: uncharacterized protein LOC108362494 isoform X2 [Rhagoletis zephyria]|uniref:uncharacterized protein LOC108362494 isoform X2 n=2 Tax=Rhagoletis zephyria TaxID=28612 RepID=UPI0008115B23|nr:PREDICTED: uncharacterized protein LOC108362494 isoform X2 [Rhagoletis zephyria]
MSFKKSSNAISRNSQRWENSLIRFEKNKNRRQEIKQVDKNLNAFCRIPKKTVIIGRYNSLANVEKSKKARFKIIADELLDLWTKLNFPSIAKTSIERKVENLLKNYSKFLKRPNGKVFVVFGQLFDITNPNGIWLSVEDKKLYALQQNSNGDVGYTTEKKTNIHPSKISLLKPVTVQKKSVINASESDTTISSLEGDNELYHPETPTKRLRKVKCQTKIAVDMIEKTSLSSKKTTKVCEILVKSGIDIPAPSQSAVYKASMKSAERLEAKYMTTLQKENWCLHFDGKKFGKKEAQVVVLSNETKEVRVAVIVLENGKSVTIFEGIKEILDRFYLWNSIKMIVCDTTNVNTGKKNGIVHYLQSCFEEKCLTPPQYVGCQHHVLDLILKHVMNELLVAKAISPHIPYEIFSDLITDFQNLKQNFKQSGEKMKIPNIKWRDDMQYFFTIAQ